MNSRRQNDRGRVSTAQLKARLRALRGIEPPGRLQEKLIAGVPAAVDHRVGLHAAPRWFKAVRRIAVAAAILVVASVVVQRLIPLNGSPRIIADINDRSGRTDLVDQNHPLPRDINVADNNMVP
jgi:hypothetical protein